MDSKGQSGLEYLMTYGWALILIATVIGVLVFIVSTPVSEVVFSSSEPNKIMLRGGSVSGTTAEIKLQNITGGNITVTEVEVPPSFGTCSFNEQDDASDIDPSNTVLVTAGSPIEISCSGVSDPSGTVEITYDDFASLTWTVGIIAEGIPSAPTGCTGDLTCAAALSDADCTTADCLLDGCYSDNMGNDIVKNCSLISSNQDACDATENCTFGICYDIITVPACDQILHQPACELANCNWDDPVCSGNIDTSGLSCSDFLLEWQWEICSDLGCSYDLICGYGTYTCSEFLPTDTYCSLGDTGCFSALPACSGKASGATGVCTGFDGASCSSYLGNGCVWNG